VVGFDVYDTLLFTTGIEHGVAVNGSSDTMVDGVLGALNATMPLQDCSREYAAELVRKFREGEKQHKTVEQTNNNGTIHYEMDAGKIWQDVLSLHDKSEGVRFATIVELERSRYGVLPGVVDFLRALKENDIPIFLISNSQAYTPSILQKACGEFANLLPDDSLCFYSHRSLCSTKPVMKPSPILFNRAFETLEYFVAQNDAVSQHPRTPLQRNEVLFLGNCLRNDGAAMAAGFQFGLVDVFEARTRRDADVVHPSSYFEMGSYAALKREMLD
jgi:FMN phosphatase YigB (HAD superfamily)